jgi:hypothetical protein
MRALRFTSLVLPGFLASAFLLSGQQAPPQRDPQALLLLQRALAVLGRTVPADSVATGSVALVEGSKSESGTIRILTRGLDQSAEQIQTPDESRSIVYSQGRGNRIDNSGTTAFTLELAASSQTPCFPLVLVATALNNPDYAFQYLGLEPLGGAQAHHLRVWNTFSSNTKLQRLAEFTAKDLWIDAASGVPLKLSFTERPGGGAASRIPVVVFYSDYRSLGGVLYPFRVDKSFNGTPWAKITIAQVAFNTGLTDADFPVQ